MFFTTQRRKETQLVKGRIVASLDVVMRMLADPDWSIKAKEVKTLEEMRQILLDFCKAKGEIIHLDKEQLFLCY